MYSTTVTAEYSVEPCLYRGLLGDTPDISKALRQLVIMKRLIRQGKGGRTSPFEYQVYLLFWLLIPWHLYHFSCWLGLMHAPSNMLMYMMRLIEQ